MNNNRLKLMIEKITLERTLKSSTFDNILDEINCPKNFDKIIETLKAQKIKKWQSDLEKIYINSGCDDKYIDEEIASLEKKVKQYNKFEYYAIEDISKVLPKEKIENIYDKNNIYRLMLYDNQMNLIIFYN